MKLTRFLPLLVLFLVSCGNFALTPEQAVQQDLLQNFQAQAGTIRIHQNQPWRDSQIVLASFMSFADNQQSNCEAVFEMVSTGIGWQLSGSGIGCASPPSNEAVRSGSGTQGVKPDQLSYAYGIVNIAEAQWVEITWQDGSVNRVQVLNGSYLVLRDGSFPMIARVEVLDSSEEIIHQIDLMPDVNKLP
jgi:hypothetical protein